MANILSQFLTDRFITSQVDVQVANALSKSASTPPLAFGVSSIPDVSLHEAIGQIPEFDYVLLYAIYRVNADVATCVKLISGGVTAQGWFIGLMDEKAKPTAAQTKKMQEIELWLKNPNPSKRFSLLLNELVAHLLISGDAYWNKVASGKQPIPSCGMSIRPPCASSPINLATSPVMSSGPSAKGSSSTRKRSFMPGCLIRSMT